MRKEAVLLRIEHGEVTREIKTGFFTVNFGLPLRQRGFKAICRALVVGTEDHRVATFHAEPQLVVGIANLSELLPDRWFDCLVVGARYCADDSGTYTELLVLDVERKCAIFQDGRAFQQHVVAKLIRRPDSHFDSAVGRSQVIAGLRRRVAGAHKQEDKDCRQVHLTNLHWFTIGTGVHCCRAPVESVRPERGSVQESA